MEKKPIIINKNVLKPRSFGDISLKYFDLSVPKDALLFDLNNLTVRSYVTYKNQTFMACDVGEWQTVHKKLYVFLNDFYNINDWDESLTDFIYQNEIYDAHLNSYEITSYFYLINNGYE